MGDLPRVRLTPSRSIRRPTIPAVSTLVGVAGGLVSVAALVICAILAVVFAATLAVVMVLASLLLALSGLAWRLQSRPPLRSAAIRPRTGHAWVAYDWNRHAG
jgi:predicted lysophospholipase L1 biosynthesis ABC-type transport system permease subunit